MGVLARRLGKLAEHKILTEHKDGLGVTGDVQISVWC